MIDAKYKRYLRKLDRYNPQLSIIERLDQMRAVLALDPVKQRVYFVYQEKVKVFPYESLKGVDYDLDNDYLQGGSLGGTLLGGLLLGDFGALLGSGLLSPGYTIRNFILTISFYKKKSFQLSFRYHKSYETLLADYEIIRDVLWKIIWENEKKNERNPYDSSIVQKKEKDAPEPKSGIETNETDVAKSTGNIVRKNTQQITNKQCLILIGIAIAIYLIILGFGAKYLIETKISDKQDTEPEEVMLVISPMIEESVGEEVLQSEDSSSDEEICESEIAQTYTIQKGDTLSRIAKKLDTTVEKILSVNPQITDKNKIYPGEVISY